MNESGIHIKEIPKLNKPLLVAGFDGWGDVERIAPSIETSYQQRIIQLRQVLDLNSRFIHRRNLPFRLSLVKFIFPKQVHLIPVDFFKMLDDQFYLALQSLNLFPVGNFPAVKFIF